MDCRPNNNLYPEEGHKFFDEYRSLAIDSDKYSLEETGYFRNFLGGTKAWRHFMTRWEYVAAPEIIGFERRFDFVIKSIDGIQKINVIDGPRLSKLSERDILAEPTYFLDNGVCSNNRIITEHTLNRSLGCTIQGSAFYGFVTADIVHIISGDFMPTVMVPQAILCLWPEMRLLSNGDLEWKWFSSIFSWRHCRFEGKTQYGEGIKSTISQKMIQIMKFWMTTYQTERAFSTYYVEESRRDKYRRSNINESAPGYILELNGDMEI